MRKKEEEKKRKDNGNTGIEKSSIPKEDESNDPRSGVDKFPDNSEEPYPPELLNNLIFRYEEPSTMSRWDKPLFTVPWADPSPPAEDIWTAVTGIPLQKPSIATEHSLPANLSSSAPAPSDITSTAPSTATTAAPNQSRLVRPRIIPHQATVQPASTDPSALYALEKRTSEIISTLRTFSLENPTAPSNPAADPENPGITIPIPSTKTPVFIPSAALASTATEELAGAGGVLALPRLQRLRRQWVGMNRAYVGQGHGRGQGALGGDQAGDAFVRFLNAEFESMES